MLPHITCGIFVTGIKEALDNTALRPISLANGCRTDEFVALLTFDDRNFGKWFKEGIDRGIPSLGESFWGSNSFSILIILIYFIEFTYRVRFQDFLVHFQ